MTSANWLNKWVLMLLAGIIIQTIVYPAAWLFEHFSHPFFNEVLLIGLASVGVQLTGFFVIMGKTREADADIYGQGRPFQHKLREEDEDLATRKPTF
jgi:Zn-dependent protease with chaperone function